MCEFSYFCAVNSLYHICEVSAHILRTVFLKRNSNLTKSLSSENKFPFSQMSVYSLKVSCSKCIRYVSSPSVRTREDWMFLYPVVSVLVRVTFNSQCVCPLFSQYITDLRLILWEIFFDANIKAWISSGWQWKKVSSHSHVVKKYEALLTKESVVIIRSPFFSPKM